MLKFCRFCSDIGMIIVEIYQKVQFNPKYVTMKKLLFLLSIAIVFVSCEKEQIIEVENNCHWKLHPAFVYDNVSQLNSHASKDAIFFLGYEFFARIENAGGNSDISDEYVEFYELGNEQPSQSKFPISDDYFISRGRQFGYLRFAPNENPMNFNGSSDFFLSMTDVDSTFYDFDFLSYASGECIKINNSKQALVPYQVKVDAQLLHKLALVSVKIEQSYYNILLDTIKTQIIEFPDIQNQSVIALESVDDYFFVTLSSSVYRVDSLGDIVKVFDGRIYRMFSDSDSYYGITHDNLYRSRNEGLSWEQVVQVQFELSQISMTNVDDRIVGFRYGQLWEFVMDGDVMIARELDNDGLDGNSITSVSVRNGRVYLTTLSGVYYKSIDKFFISDDDFLPFN